MQFCMLFVTLYHQGVKGLNPIRQHIQSPMKPLSLLFKITIVIWLP